MWTKQTTLTMQEKFHYTHDGLTILWQPKMCAHTGICFRGLPGVFDPRRRPWIEMDKGTHDQILAQVKECPSGALSIVPTPEKS